MIDFKFLEWFVKVNIGLWWVKNMKKLKQWAKEQDK